jgi:hypothetical protein
MGLHHHVFDGKPLAGNYGLSHDKLLGVPVNVTPIHGIYPQKNEFHRKRMRSSPSTPLIFTTAKNMGSLAEPWDGSTWLVDL